MISKNISKLEETPISSNTSIKLPPSLSQRFKKRRTLPSLKSFSPKLATCWWTFIWFKLYFRYPSIQSLWKNWQKIKETCTLKWLRSHIVVVLHARKYGGQEERPGAFTIPCTIGVYQFGKSWYDLGASINLMPLSIFNKFELGAPKSKTIRLLMVNHKLNNQ